jgi:hypothetical protein
MRSVAVQVCGSVETWGQWIRPRESSPAVRDVTVEGADQIERRPSVAAVLVFGVLGLGASKAIKRSYLVISSDNGDYVLERQELLPLELSGYLAPVLREMHHVAQQDDPMTRLLEAQQETNRLLALIVERLPERGGEEH